MQTLNTPQRAQASFADPDIREELRQLLTLRRSGVLATARDNQPLCSQMAFAVSDDLRTLLVLTPRQSAKFENMSANPKVSFLVTTAENTPADPATAQVLSIQGEAHEVCAEHKTALLNIFCAKHPELTSFAEADSSALVEIRANSMNLISQFQNITHIQL